MDAFNALLNSAGKGGGKQGNGKGTSSREHDGNAPQNGAIPPVQGQLAGQPAAPAEGAIPIVEN